MSLSGTFDASLFPSGCSYEQEAETLPAQQVPLYGDFYGIVGNNCEITRGISWVPTDADKEAASSSKLWDHHVQTDLTGAHTWSSTEKPLFPAPTKFEELDLAPEIPDDPLFDLEATTFYSEDPASAIGNRILRLLQDHGAFVSKVNRSKMSVKANVDIRGLPCMLKVCLYRTERACETAVEFQHRRGNKLAFHAFFRQAQRCFDIETIPEDESQINLWASALFHVEDPERGNTEYVPRFQDLDVPLPVPSDPCWDIEETTLFLPDTSALVAGNRVADFLESTASRREVTVKVTKLNLVKFSMQADACIQGHHCSFKARICQWNSGVAIEFQRHRGSTFAFSKIFAGAREFVEALDTCTSSATLEPSPIEQAELIGVH